MFPNRPDLVQQIPQPSDLDIGKLYNGSIVTDTCDQAWKQRCLLALTVKNAAQKMGKADDEICILEIDCWHHICNVWLGNVSKRMNKTLQEVHGDQLSDLPSNYHIHTDIVALLQAIQKECAKTANIAKGHGDEFHYYMKMYHPEA